LTASKLAKQRFVRGEWSSIFEKVGRAGDVAAHISGYIILKKMSFLSKKTWFSLFVCYYIKLINLRGSMSFEKNNNS
jgi:hypothetical protein